MFWDRVRTLGAAVGAVTAYWAVVAAGGLVIVWLAPSGWSEGIRGILLGSAPFIVTALLTNWVLVRRGRSSWGELGWRMSPRAMLRRGMSGVIYGVALAAVALLVVFAFGGGLSITPDPVTAYLRRALRIGGVLLVAALSEELLFRGYPLARLSRVVGRIGASASLAVGFALLHLANPGVTAYGLLNIGLASLVLSAAFFTRGAMVAAWGLHFGWNAGLALLADAPVSGVALRLPLLEYHPGRPPWITGGGFGPEGGLAATVAMLCGLAVLVHIVRRRDRLVATA